MATQSVLLTQNRIWQKIGKGADSVRATVSPWARESYDWAIETKISDGTRPKDFVTREGSLGHAGKTLPAFKGMNKNEF